LRAGLATTGLPAKDARALASYVARNRCEGAIVMTVPRKSVTALDCGTTQALESETEGAGENDEQPWNSLVSPGSEQEVLKNMRLTRGQIFNRQPHKIRRRHSQRVARMAAPD